MKYIDEFRDAALVRSLVQRIRQRSNRSARLMEFCGGHTVAIYRNGLRQLFPPTVELLSGPGCPICVTPNVDIDKVISLSRIPGVIIATFGDLMKVPGSRSSLQRAKAEGADVRIVYSTMDAVQIARDNHDKSVVFVGIGFETTAPTVAASVVQAQREGMKNYFVLSLHKLTPPVIRALLSSGEVNLDGIICPGHVSTIIGSEPYEPIVRDFRIACVISGFEPLDILQASYMLMVQIEEEQPRIEIAYRRAVRPEGNREALALMNKVFSVGLGVWRGIGGVAHSGLKLSEEYRDFDAEVKFEVTTDPPVEHQGCLCGEVLRGVKVPTDCQLFSDSCTPEHPVGPCMVSSEGSCSAVYLFGGAHG